MSAHVKWRGDLPPPLPLFSFYFPCQHSHIRDCVLLTVPYRGYLVSPLAFWRPDWPGATHCSRAGKCHSLWISHSAMGSFQPWDLRFGKVIPWKCHLITDLRVFVMTPSTPPEAWRWSSYIAYKPFIPHNSMIYWFNPIGTQVKFRFSSILKFSQLKSAVFLRFFIDTKYWNHWLKKKVIFWLNMTVRLWLKKGYF